MTETTLLTEAETAQGETTQQYVTFSLNNEIYAIEVLKVKEIIELTYITRVPHLPHFLKGVINLRGTIIPVVDLKLKFGMKSTKYQKHTCIIITEFSQEVMGLIVDSVSDVVQLLPEEISEAPSFGLKIRTDFIKGMAKIGDTLVIVLDIERVLSDEGISLITDMSSFEEFEEEEVSDNGSNRINFSVAKNKHLIWKTRLRAFLDGKESLTEREAVSHEECELGRWLYSEGMPKYGDIKEMRELERRHAELHSTVKSIIGLKQSGNTDEAEQLYKSIESLSEQIIALLDAIEGKVA